MRTLFALAATAALAAPLASLVVAPAFAQMPQPGTTAAGPAPSALTPAPVPSQAPLGPSSQSPSAVPERIAPPGGAASGPASATPFSAAPTGTGDALAPGTSTSPTLSK